jgi:hypothetical protein
MRLATFLIVIPVFSQVTVTATATAPDLVKAFLERTIQGAAAFSVAVCGPPGSRASAGDVIQEAARQNVFLFAPNAIDALGARALGRSKSQIVADVGEGLALAGTFMTGANIVKLTDQEKTKAVSVGAGLVGLAQWLSGKLKASAPDPTKLRTLDLPDQIELPTGGCWTGITLGRAQG